VIGEVGSGEEAIREAAVSKPDVIVMDLRMPGMSGAEATEAILRRDPDANILVLTMFDEDAMVGEALRAGARGYLLKGAEQDEIERAIRAVAAGEAIFSSSVAAKVLGRLGRPAPAPNTALSPLTARERDVLELIAQGLANAAIASQLHIALKTVGNHISAIFLKLGVATRAEAIVLARDEGLGHG